MYHYILPIAQRHVNNFRETQREFAEHHGGSLACQDYDNLFRLGVHAFEWIMDAEYQCRKVVIEGNGQHSLDLKNIKLLFVKWLEVASNVNEEIAELECTASEARYLSQFRDCQAAIIAMLGNDQEQDSRGTR